jgi:hypothetical protein
VIVAARSSKATPRHAHPAILQRHRVTGVRLSFTLLMEAGMKKLLGATLVAITLFPGICLADGYGGIPAKFFSYIEQGKTNAAIEYLYGTNKWVNQNSDQVVNLKTQLERLNQLVGRYLFHELIVEQKVGERYSHLVYLVGYERQPLRFEIKMYRPEAEWRFHGVSFDTDLTADIDKQVNASLIRK